MKILSAILRAAKNFRFGLRGMFIVISLLCVLLGFLIQPWQQVRRQRQLVQEARDLGAKVSQFGSTPREPSVAGSLLAAFVNSEYDRAYIYHLDFSGTPLNDKQLAHFANIDWIGRLTLRDTKITDAALKYLARQKFLRYLDLSGTAVTDDGVEALAQMPGLISLNAERTQVSYAALEKLDQALPHAQFCEERALKELKAAGLGVVVQPRFVDLNEPAGHTESVQRIDAPVDIELHGTKQTQAKGRPKSPSLTAADVKKMNYLQSLQEFFAHSVAFEPDCFSKLQTLPKLRQIAIYSTNLSNDDLIGIGRQTQLETLTIGYCNTITDAALENLANLNKLKKLSIRGCTGISQDAIKLLREKLPNCQIERGS